VKDFIINLLVGTAAMAAFVGLVLAGVWVKQHGLDWIIVGPCLVFMYCVVAAAVGFLIRTFIEDCF
jgi:hypothetical protein